MRSLRENMRKPRKAKRAKRTQMLTVKSETCRKYANANSENSYLKVELLAVEKKLQLALPALPMMRGRRPRGVVEGRGGQLRTQTAAAVTFASADGGQSRLGLRSSRPTLCRSSSSTRFSLDRIHVSRGVSVVPLRPERGSTRVTRVTNEGHEGHEGPKTILKNRVFSRLLNNFGCAMKIE